MSAPATAIQDWEYQDESSVVVPFTASAWPESFLADLYFKAKRTGIMEAGLPGRTVAMTEWITKVSQVPLLICMAKPKLDVAGFGILWEREGDAPFSRGSFGFGFFPEYWGTSRIRTMARMGVRLWHERYGIERLWGVTLKSNRPARRFAGDIGFAEVAEIPQWFVASNGFHDAVVYVHARGQQQCRQAAEPRG